MQSTVNTKPAKTGAFSLLFSFNFLVEEVCLRTDCVPGPGVSFRLLDFPTIVLPLPVPPSKKGDVIQNHLQHLLSKDGALKLNKGKSCLFEMTLDSLVGGLRENPVLVQFVDLQLLEEGVLENEPRVLKVIGSVLINMSETATALDSSVKESGKTSKCSVGSRKELCFADASGAKVAMLYIKYQLVCCGTPAGPRITGGNMSEDSSLQPPQDAHANESLPCDQEQKESSNASEMPYKVAFVTDKVLNNGIISNRSASSGLGVADEQSECSYPNESVISVIYLPNAVCPPPLFYRSDPKPQDVKRPDCFIQCTNRHEVINDNTDCVTDSEQSHWTVLMAHDQSSHPLVVKNNPGLVHASDPVKSGSASNLVLPHDKNLTSLPLLSALLGELSILQSHISQPTLQTTTVPNKVEPETVSKCLQTDMYIQPPVCKLHKNKQNDTSQHTLHRHFKTDHSSKFFRKCCMPVHPNALRVPKHKSVIYPPDIARVRRRNFLARKAANAERLPPGMQRGATKRTEKQAQLKPILATKECSNESSIATLAEEKVSKKETSAQTAMRKLEVFIPQALYPIKSSEMSLLSGSSVPLKSCDKTILFPDEEQEAQTADTHGDQLMDAGTRTELLVDTEPVVDAPKDQESVITHTSQFCQGAITSPKLSPQEDGSQWTSKSVSQSEGSMGTPQQTEEGLKCLENYNIAPQIFVTKPFVASNINTIVPRAGGNTGLSQEHPTPSYRASIDGLYVGKKQSSLLNIASQTFDSFMSTDSLDVMDSAVLPNKQQREGVLYLASSQSTMGESSQSDYHVDQLEHSNSKCDDSYSYSQDYPDDFEQVESDSSSSSSS